jgi:hypothetical protein
MSVLWFPVGEMISAKADGEYDDSRSEKAVACCLMVVCDASGIRLRGNAQRRARVTDLFTLRKHARHNRFGSFTPSPSELGYLPGRLKSEGNVFDAYVKLVSRTYTVPIARCVWKGRYDWIHHDLLYCSQGNAEIPLKRVTGRLGVSTSNF